MADDIARLNVWQVDVGRIKLYLLDAAVDTNSPEIAAITNRLYGGDIEHRLRQEIVLGIGGVRALRALGLQPQVFHTNEGHAGFLSLETDPRAGRDRPDIRRGDRGGARPAACSPRTPRFRQASTAFRCDLMEKYFTTYATSSAASTSTN